MATALVVCVEDKVHAVGAHVWAKVDQAGGTEGYHMDGGRQGERDETGGVVGCVDSTIKKAVRGQEQAKVKINWKRG